MNRNEMMIKFMAQSINESFARVAVAAFLAPLNPSVEELSDVKTAVAEAVTNALIHGYEEDPQKEIELRCMTQDKDVHIEVIDTGKGIPDIEKAREPFYTTRPEWENAGMGIAMMEAFMDSVVIESKENEGTRVIMTKRIGTV